MIPKIIHYCWFGGKKMPATERAYIEGWRKKCPDYNIVEWNETNFDLDLYPYAREAYDAKKWAFVTDVVRLYVLAEYGGIYMDTDVELLKPLDFILSYKAVSGFESTSSVPTGLMASEKGNDIILELLSEYNHAHFIQANGAMDLTTNVVRITNTLKKHGLVLNDKMQDVDGFTLFPSDYFCARNPKNGRVLITKNTVSVHHFAGSWLEPRIRYHIKIYRLLEDIFGEKCARRVQSIARRKK